MTVANEIKVRTYITSLSHLIVIVFAIYLYINLMNDWLYMPILDDWYFVEDIANNNKTTIAWIYDWYGPYRLIFTKFIYFISMNFNNFNYKILISINFLFYIGSISLIVYFVKNKIKSVGIGSLVFLPFFSGIIILNIGWPFQSAFHLNLFFSFCAIYCAFYRPIVLRNALLVFIFIVMSMYSNMPIPSLVVSFMYLLRGFYIFYIIGDKHKLLCVTLITILTLVSCAIYFMGYTTTSSGNRVNIDDFRFIEYFVNCIYTVIYGKSFHTVYPLYYFLLFFGCLSCLLTFACNKKNLGDNDFWAILTVLAISLAMTLIVAQFRSATYRAPLVQHLHPILFMIPCGLALIMMAFSEMRLLRYIISILYIGFILQNYHQRFFLKYEKESWLEIQMNQKKIIDDYIMTGTYRDGAPIMTRKALDLAISRNMKFLH